MTLSLTYDPLLSRVRISATGVSALDTFTRTGSSGWGTSDTGQAWTTSGGTGTDYSTNGTAGVHSLGSVNVLRESQLAVTYADVDVTVRGITVSAAATGAPIEQVVVARRFDASNLVDVRLFRNTSGAPSVAVRQLVAGVQTVSAFVAVSGATATSTLAMRLQAIGSTLRGKAWLDSGSEPAAWQVEMTATHLSAGAVAVRSLLEAGNTNTLPVTVSYSSVSVTPTVVVQRSTDQVRWTTVRGGAALAVPSDPAALDDYEFTPDVPNWYRVAGQTASITPTLDAVWVKSVARPFLNRAVTPRDFSEVSRPSRTGLFSVVGRSFPVAVTDLRGSRRWTLLLKVADSAEAELVDLLAASGDILLIQAPSTGRVSAVPTGYVALGDTSETVLPTSDLAERTLSWQCTEVAAPGPDVVGATSNWQTVLSTYATWSDLLAANATWQDVAELVGSPTDVIVS